MKIGNNKDIDSQLRLTGDPFDSRLAERQVPKGPNTWHRVHHWIVI